jgi:hypothetical protein
MGMAMAANALVTVQDYVDNIRVLLQDLVQPYRYSDDNIITGMNVAFAEGLRLRSDLFVCPKTHRIRPLLYLAPSGDKVPIEPQHRLAFVLGATGYTLLSDEEDVQDSRANSLTDAMETILCGVRKAPITGGTPSPAKAGAKGE